MPNGFYGSRREWDRIEAPLLQLDSSLESFANEHGMSLGRNYHNWPERSLRWGIGINRLIQICLEDDDGTAWNVWLCASEDRPSGRYWRHYFLRRAVSIEAIRTDLKEGLLEEAHALVTAWSGDDLEFAAELK